jgi:hypothetical protein
VTSGQKGADTPAKFARVQIGGMQGLGVPQNLAAPYRFWKDPALTAHVLADPGQRIAGFEERGLSLGALDWARDPGRDRV